MAFWITNKLRKNEEILIFTLKRISKILKTFLQHEQGFMQN